MNQDLSRSFTPEEVKNTLFQMHPSKALGPDDMSLIFYQNYWHIVGPTIIDAIISSLNSRTFPHTLNHTHIVLIPKKKCPEKVGDFQPISLCNVLYKIISKIITNRLKNCMHILISSAQSAFVLG